MTSPIRKAVQGKNREKVADPNMNDQRVHAVIMRDVRDGKG